MIGPFVLVCFACLMFWMSCRDWRKRYEELSRSESKTWTKWAQLLAKYNALKESNENTKKRPTGNSSNRYKELAIRLQKRVQELEKDKSASEKQIADLAAIANHLSGKIERYKDIHVAIEEIVNDN
jgi:hypothetical protein